MKVNDFPQIKNQILSATKEFAQRADRAPVSPEKLPNLQEKMAQKNILQRGAKRLNAEMLRQKTDVSFRYDDFIDALVVVVKSPENEKIIREIPNKEAISMLKRFHEIVGIIFDDRG